VLIVHGGQEAMLLRSGEAVTLAGSPGDLVSLLPLGGDARGVTTAGLAWPLARETLRFGQSRGVSNEMSAAEATSGSSRRATCGWSTEYRGRRVVLFNFCERPGLPCPALESRNGKET
jgi:hypothetical protein